MPLSAWLHLREAARVPLISRAEQADQRLVHPNNARTQIMMTTYTRTKLKYYLRIVLATAFESQNDIGILSLRMQIKEY